MSLSSFLAFLPLANNGELHFGFICLIYLVGIVILLFEMVLPGAVLGVVGVAIVIGSVVLAFWHHPDKPWYGVSLMLLSLVILPSMLIWVLRRITLNSAQNLEDGYNSGDEGLEKLVGQQGVAVTPLRPSGMATIDGKRVDVTCETQMLEVNTPIQVVKIEGNRVVVKAIGSAPSQEN